MFQYVSINIGYVGTSSQISEHVSIGCASKIIHEGHASQTGTLARLECKMEVTVHSVFHSY